MRLSVSLVLIVLISMMGLGICQGATVTGTVPKKVSLSMYDPGPNNLGDPDQGNKMYPRAKAFTTGNDIIVEANCPFQIDTKCDPASGTMISGSGPLSNAMSIAMNSHTPFSLGVRPFPTETFERPLSGEVDIPVSFRQLITWSDIADKYRLTITFEASEI